MSSGHLDYKPGDFRRDTSGQHHSGRVYRLKRENAGQNPREYHHLRGGGKQKRPKGNSDTMNSKIREKNTRSIVKMTQ